MAAPPEPVRVKVARRVGMTLVVALIVWTLVAVTVGVLRGIADPQPPSAETEAPSQET